MLNQIKALLNDAQLRKQIQQATSIAEAVTLIKTAGVKKGYQFSSYSLFQIFQSQIKLPSEKELLVVAGSVHVPTYDCQTLGCY